MEKGMQDYLRLVAVKTKIENFRDFEMTKDETEKALIKTFDFSEEEAKEMIMRFWEGDSSDTLFEGGNSPASKSYEDKKAKLILEKEQKIREYDLAINVLNDATNGFSSEIIANRNGISLKKVEEILAD